MSINTIEPTGNNAGLFLAQAGCSGCLAWSLTLSFGIPHFFLAKDFQ
jgi:hypothetical protein